MLFALIFGWSGDIRTGRDHIISQAAPSFSYPDWLPSAFIWIYIYFTSPLGNLNYNIEISQNILPFEIIGAILPSFIRDDFVSIFGASTEWGLVSDSFNVSTLLKPFLMDFGLVGTLFVTFFLGIIFSRILRKSETSLAAYFCLIIILHGIFFSFFANLLIHLVFIFQMFVVFMICRRVDK
jgi:oligosaccharide repeat unit polymerase